MGRQPIAEFVSEPGQTPIDPDEREGLIPDIATRDELNALEAANIAVAVAWLRRARSANPLSTAFLKLLHKKMFSKVWKWAGKYRRSEKNLGGPWETVPLRVEELVRDVAVQVKEKFFSADEIAVRYHHRLVFFIHPFPNGNGRHARMATDLLLARVLGRPAFSWGSAALGQGGDARPRYIDALRQADGRDYAGLLSFVRS